MLFLPKNQLYLMGYSQIEPEDIFIYKALPSSMRDRVTRLPPLPEEVKIEPVITGFPMVDSRMQEATISTIDFSSLPERKLSGCSFMDEFATLVHTYGFKDMLFYATELLKNAPATTNKRGMVEAITPTQLGNTIRVLTGMSGREWVSKYTLMMVNDIRHRSTLNGIEITRLLHFSTRQSFVQFMSCYDKRKLK